MPNFNLIGSGVSEPQVAENRYLILIRSRPYNSVPVRTDVLTDVLHCDICHSTLEVGQLCHTGTSLVGSKLYFQFFREKHHVVGQ